MNKSKRDISIALYRLPGEGSYYRIEQMGEPYETTEVQDVNGRSGFVFAPFRVRESSPIIIFSSDNIKKMEVGMDDAGEGMVTGGTEAEAREAYGKMFEEFHEAIEAGRFKKLVLSRTLELRVSPGVEAERLFLRACRRYPRLFISLVSTKKTGTWLMATPEPLLWARGAEMGTVALAGTQRQTASEPTWDAKNRAEQEIVTQYIEETLRPMAKELTKTEPKTVFAANLMHLRTDFSFSLKEGKSVGDVIEALHPTPAVCGLPKAAAQAFIEQHETHERQYYSGFLGPVNIEGRTDIFVSLRCGRIEGERVTLFAGGGIMAESDVEAEYFETEAKMETIRNLI